jgi:glycosyltransferase involved in cell wall biosynthesis
MKICYLANAASIHTHRWATHFSKMGHDVTVVSLTNASIPGVNVRWLGTDPNVRGRIAYMLCLPHLRRTLRVLKPDIVHAHYAGGYGLVGALAGFHPLVLTAWGSDVLILPQSSRLMRWLVKFALRRADLVTSMARHMTLALRELGVSAGRLITLPFGVDTSIFHPGGRPSSSAADPVIVSTRHLEPLYNVGLLIEALPEIAATHPTVKLVLLGDGSERERLEQRARQLNMAQRVVFLGRKRPQDVAQQLWHADVFVSTSLSDGNNISLNEAMACGAFPVATDISANREWIRHGENGFLTDLHDPHMLANLVIHALERNSLRRAAASANWKVIQQRGSWASAMETMEAQYRKLIHHSGDPEQILIGAGAQEL